MQPASSNCGGGAIWYSSAAPEKHMQPSLFYLNAYVNNNMHVSLISKVSGLFRFSSLHKSNIRLSSNCTHYDIVISGGGMVGFAMACSLGKKKQLVNKKILLLESSPKKIKRQESFGLRVCALNPATKRYLESVGAWKHIENNIYGPVINMQIWDSCSDAAISFGKAGSTDKLAYIVENDLVQESLEQETAGCENVEVMYGSKVVNYQLPKHSDGETIVTLEDGSCKTTSLLIGADGYNSGLRRAMNVQYLKYDYEQMGVVATLRISEADKNETAWQRFLPSGPIALLPLTNEVSSLVWTTNNTEARELLQLSDDMFVDRVNKALWDDTFRNNVAQEFSEKLFQLAPLKLLVSSNDISYRIRQLPPSIVNVLGKRAAFPLGFGHAIDYVTNGAALIGDAAHRVHPMAGLGVNLGFGDVACLTETISDAVDAGCDVGNYYYLTKYQSSQLLKNLPVMGAVHSLHLLFKSTSVPIVGLRSFGMNVLDTLTSVKNLVEKRAAL